MGRPKGKNRTQAAEVAAAQSAAAIEFCRQKELMSKAENFLEDFKLAHSAMVDTLDRFVSGDINDFQAVLGGLALWSTSKLALCVPFDDLLQPMSKHRGDKESLMQGYGDRFTVISFVMLQMTSILGKVMDQLEQCPEISKAESVEALKIITDTEDEWTRIGKSMDRMGFYRGFTAEVQDQE